jgi:hypothetical protein
MVALGGVGSEKDLSVGVDERPRSECQGAVVVRSRRLGKVVRNSVVCGPTQQRLQGGWHAGPMKEFFQKLK